MIEYPSFWPRIPFGSLRPIVTSKKILTLLDCEKPLPANVADGLRRLGFQPSAQREGRWILPKVITADEFWKVAGIRAIEEPFDPVAAVYLSDAPKLSPKIPAEIRDGIAWWMRHDPQSLMNEIRLTLETLPAEALDGESRPNSETAYQNMERLREWVHLALQGELTPVTEPIISMGLTKALAAYSDQIPEDLDHWVQVLREYRGEPADQIVEIALFTPKGEALPAIRTRVQWSDSEGVVREGVCIGHAETGDAIWVAASDPVWVGNMPWIDRHLVKVDRLINFGKPEAVDKVVATDQTPGPSSTKGQILRFTYPDEPVHPEIQEKLLTLWKQGALEVVPFWEVVDPDNDLDPDDYVRSAFSTDHSMFQDVFHDQVPVRQQWLMARLNDDWNKLQEHVPDNLKGVFSIIPVSLNYPTVGLSANRIDQGMFYGMALHPDFMREYRQRLKRIVDEDDSLSSYNIHTYRNVICELERSREFQRFYGDSRRLLFWPRINHRSIKNNERVISRDEPVLDGVLYRSASDLGAAIRDHFSAENEGIRISASNNKRILEAISELAGDVRMIRHPLIVMSDMLTDKGVWPADTALDHQLAALGIDLSKDERLAGELMHFAGFRIHSKVHVNEEHGLIGVVCQISKGGSQEGKKFASVLVKSPSMEHSHLMAIGDDLTSHDRIESLQQKLLTMFVHWRLMGVPIKDDVSGTEEPYPLTLNEDYLKVEQLNTSSVVGVGLSQYLRSMSQVEIDELPQDIKEINRLLLNSLLQTSSIESNLKMVEKTVDTMVRQNKHLGQMTERSITEFVNKIVSMMADTEIVIVQYTSTARRIRWSFHKVSLREIEEVGFDRSQAIEKAKLFLSNRPRMGRAQYLVFDRLAIANPDQYKKAMASINASVERPALQTNDQNAAEAKAEDKEKSGKRTDTGVVYGFSIKDLRRSSQEVVRMLDTMTPEQREKWVTKTKLWPAPSWVDMRQSGEYEPVAAALNQGIRNALPSAPPSAYLEAQSLFADAVTTIRDWCNKIKTYKDIENSLQELTQSFKRLRRQSYEKDIPASTVLGEIGRWEWRDDSSVHTFKFLFLDKALRQTKTNTAWPDDFGVTRGRRTKESAEVGALPMLERINRAGTDHRKGLDVTEEDLIRTFGFSGVEYGESMPQKERTLYLNYAYDAFADLAELLNVPPKALSLGGTLGLAFGSRGRGGRRAAIAHYERTNNAINLTRLKGAGSAGHEYGHALSTYFFNLIGHPNETPDIAEFIGNPRRFAFHDGNMMGLRKEIYNAFVRIMAVIMRERGDNQTYYAQVSLDASRLHLESAAAGSIQSLRNNAKYLEKFLEGSIQKIAQDNPEAAQEASNELVIVKDFLNELDGHADDITDYVLKRAKEIVESVGHETVIDMRIQDGLEADLFSFLAKTFPTLESLSKTSKEILMPLDHSILHRAQQFVRENEMLNKLKEKEVELTEVEKSGSIDLNVYGRASLMLRSAMELDKKRSKPYWSSPAEMFARAFEAWLAYAFVKSGKQNDYLVRADKMKHANPVLKPSESNYQLYPEPDRMPEIDAAFRNLFDQIKIQHQQILHPVLGETEIPVMYSRDAVYRQDPSTRSILARCALSEIARMCGPNVELEWVKSMRDEEGKPVAGSFHPLANQMIGLIRFAEDVATMDTVYHEAFHYAQQCLLTKEDLAVLDYEFSAGQPLYERLVQCLVAQGKGHLIDELSDPREAQAYAYQEWVSGRFHMSDIEQPKSIFGAIRKFFRAILGIRDDYGFKSAEQIFRAFYEGRYAPSLAQEGSQPKNVIKRGLNSENECNSVVDCLSDKGMTLGI